MAIQLLNDETFTVKDDELPGVTDGDPEVTYTIRQISFKTAEAITAKNTSRKPDGRTGQMVAVIDQRGAGLDILDYVLVGWTGVLLLGEPAPCERDLKVGIGSDRMQALIELARTPRRTEVARQESFRPAS